MECVVAVDEPDAGFGRCRRHVESVVGARALHPAGLGAARAGAGERAAEEPEAEEAADDGGGLRDAAQERAGRAPSDGRAGTRSGLRLSSGGHGVLLGLGAAERRARL